MSGLTRERPAPGVVVYQPARGFRYAMDPFLLVGWSLEGGVPRTALDVGTGSGIIALLLASAGVRRVNAIDVRPEWIDLARRSALESELPVRLSVADVRAPGPAVELAVCNPPFFPLGAGALPSNPWRAWGRHELAGTLTELLAGMARRAERVAAIVPAARLAEAQAALAAAGRPLARRCRVGGKLVLIEGRPDGDLIEDTAIPTRGPDGAPHPRVVAWYRRVGARPPAPSTRSTDPAVSRAG